MSFLSLSPAMVGALLAATAVAIAILYWLKPPPTRVIVPSSILWNRLLRERKRTTFLDRLRWWISLLIALTIGLSVAMAMSRPELSGGGEPGKITVVIDNSATMATRTSDGFTRWDHAVAHARSLLQQGGAGGDFLIVDTTGQAPPTEPGTRRGALEQLDGLTVSLGGQAQFPLLTAGDDDLYFISDGVMVDTFPAEATLISVFEPADNIGITAFEIRSVPAAPLTYQAFLEVSNTSPGPKEVAIRLSGAGADDRLGQTVALQPGESHGLSIPLSEFDRGPVRAAVTTDGDAFAPDDYAYSYLPVRSRTSIALISEGSIYLESALAIESRIDLRFLTPDEYSERTAADVFIFDRWAPPTPPPGPALLFLPMDVPWLAPTLEIRDSPAVAGWNTDHPVMQFVSLEDLRIDRAARTSLDMPGAAEGGASVEVIVGSPQMPLVLAIENPEKVLRVGFALEDSNFPLQPGFPIFLSNALSWMMDEHVAISSAPGRVEVPLAAARVEDLEGNEVMAWPLTDRTVFVADEPGLYTATRGTRRLRVAVNLADRELSAVNASSFDPGARSAAAPGLLSAVGPAGWGEELWILLLIVATLLVIGEWFTYHRRITV